MMAMRDLASILPFQAEGLTFEAEGKRLLDSVSLTLPKGGVTAVIGANGAGKSLLLRLCHGLLQPSAGSVRWHAGDGTMAGRKRHAMVFQRPVMLRRSTRANLVHALRASGAADTSRKAGEALQRFGLQEIAERPARLLSGGEQQRLALARAWALEPEVLFLDEPSSQLDPGATRQIEQIIATLAAEGITIVMATHDLGQARRLSGRILFLHRGRLAEDAATEAFFAAPATAEGKAFVAGDLLW
jgi:tungstate transport system ATP-binding protein